MGLSPHLQAAMSDSLTAELPERPLQPALLRGLRGRCPNCRVTLSRGGSAPKRSDIHRDTCPACGEDLHHQRADDGPAYATILIVGHLLAPALMWGFVTFRPDPVTLSLVAGSACVALSLFLLPRLKGAFVAIQWAKRIHGFGGEAN